MLEFSISKNRHIDKAKSNHFSVSEFGKTLISHCAISLLHVVNCIPCLQFPVHDPGRRGLVLGLWKQIVKTLHISILNSWIMELMLHGESECAMTMMRAEDLGSISLQVVHLTNKLLLKEKYNGNTEPLEFKGPDYNSTVDLRSSGNQVVGLKQEDHSSTDSAVSVSESPHCADGPLTDSSNAFEPDQSDISHVEDDEEVGGYHRFLKLDDHSGSFDFQVEDHPCWLWPWYFDLCITCFLMFRWVVCIYLSMCQGFMLM